MVNKETLDLLELLKSSDQPLSGANLARRLGVSRVALWKRFEALRAAGYAVTADHSGYRLQPSDKPLPWEFPGQEDKIVHFDTLASTMDEAFRLGLQGQTAVVVAETQTSGRGRSQRPWVSAGGDLLVTLTLRPRLPLSYAGALGLEALAALADTLTDLYGLGLTLKWPNDLVAGDQKVAGILLEACGPVEAPHFYTVGLGLNVHGRPAIDRPTASLASLGQTHADRRAILAQWSSRLNQWAAQPTVDPRRWGSLSQPSQPLVAETFDGQVHRGTFQGYDRTGSLLLAGAEQVHRIGYGESRRTLGVAP